MNDDNKNISSGSEPEINFKNVLKNPLRWFGFIYFYFLILLIAGGVFYVNNIEQINRNAITPSLTDSTNHFTDVKPVKGSISQGINTANLMNPTNEMISKGKELFDANCVSCHGENGEGNGPAGAALNPKPRNFHSTDSWKNGREFTGMFKTLREGIPNTGMPAYEYIGVQDRVNIIFYVRSLGKDFPVITENEINNLNTQYNLAKGDTISTQIPVTTAMRKLSEEALPAAQVVYSKISAMNNNPEEPGAKILNKVSRDKVRIISILNSTDGWKSNLNIFIKTIVSTSGVNGFKSNVVNLTSEEWNQLHQYLVKLYAS